MSLAGNALMHGQFLLRVVVRVLVGTVKNLVGSVHSGKLLVATHFNGFKSSISYKSERVYQSLKALRQMHFKDKLTNQNFAFSTNSPTLLLVTINTLFLFHYKAKLTDHAFMKSHIFSIKVENFLITFKV